MISRKYIIELIHTYGSSASLKSSEILTMWAAAHDIEQEYRGASGIGKEQLYFNYVQEGILPGYPKYPENAYITLHEIWVGIDIHNMLRFMVPDLVENAKETAAYYEIMPGTNVQKVRQLLWTRYALLMAHVEGIPVKDFTGARRRLYETYLKKLPPGIPTIDIDLFWSVLKCIGYIDMSSDIRRLGQTDRHAERIGAPVTTLLSAGESVADIVQYGALYYLHQTPADKLSELHCASATQERRGLFRKAVKQMSQISPIDLLCAAEFDQEDNLIYEKGVIYEKFVRSLDFGSKAILVMPSMQFIRQWMADVELREIPVDIVVQESDTRQLLALNYSDPSYCEFVHKKANYISVGDWELQLGQIDAKKYSHALVFAQNYGGNIATGLEYLATSSDQTSIFAAEACFTKEPEYRKMIYEGHGHFGRAEIYPIGVPYSKGQKKKIYATYVSGTAFASEEPCTELIRYDLDRYSWEDPAICRIMTWNPMLISENELFHCRSKRSIYKDLVTTPTPEGKQRTVATDYQYSPELKIWVSETKNGDSTIDCKAYFCEQNNSLRPRGMQRGKRLEVTLRVKRSLCEGKREEWLETEYPFLPKRRGDKHKNELGIREYIAAKIPVWYKGRAISLKTLWYGYPLLADAFSPKEYKRLAELVCTTIGWLNIDCDVPEMLWDEINRIYPTCDEAKKYRDLVLLLQTLEFGIKQTTHFGGLDFAKIKEFRRSGIKAIQEIREALTKKNFTDIELTRLADIIVDGLTSDLREMYKGAFLKLWTGLPSNMVCALRNTDLFCIGNGVWCLHVHRQVSSDGREEIPLQTNEQFRCIPCMTMLSDCLREEQHENMESANPWLIGNGEAREGLCCAITPNELNRFCRKLIEQLGIEQDLIAVPDEKRGVIETDLAAYRGDLFRENYRYLLTHKMGMTEGERAYLLGIKATKTHERYYCDYANEYKLAQMYVKMQRFQNWLQGSKVRLRPRRPVCGSISFNEVGSGPEVLDLDIQCSADGVVVIDFCSNYGVEITTSACGSEEDNNGF